MSKLSVLVTRYGDFTAAMDRAAKTGSFVADDQGCMRYSIYRPQNTPDGLTIGRYIGTVSSPPSPEYVIALLSDGRCEWCGWPARTGFCSESDQRTPKCHHEAAQS
jgi:hypothetical protein